MPGIEDVPLSRIFDSRYLRLKNLVRNWLNEHNERIMRASKSEWKGDEAVRLCKLLGIADLENVRLRLGFELQCDAVVAVIRELVQPTGRTQVMWMSCKTW